MCGSLILDEIASQPGDDPRARACKGLTLAAMASAMATDGPNVRYFQLTNKPQRHLISRHPLMCLNGTEAEAEKTVPKGEPVNLYRQAEQMSGTGRGLVFQYGDGRCGVLFCGNSNFSFATAEAGVTLSQPTVVAAPGQGGPALESAYGRITSLAPKRDIWVRTHYSHARKIAYAFSQLPNTICLSHCVHRSVQEVVLQFDDDRWRNLAGKACVFI